MLSELEGTWEIGFSKCGPPASGPPEGLVKMQILGPHLLSQNLRKWVLASWFLPNPPQFLLCTLRLESHLPVQPHHCTDSKVEVQRKDMTSILSFQLLTTWGQSWSWGPVSWGPSSPLATPLPGFCIIAGQDPDGVPWQSVLGYWIVALAPNSTTTRTCSETPTRKSSPVR